MTENEIIESLHRIIRRMEDVNRRLAASGPRSPASMLELDELKSLGGIYGDLVEALGRLRAGGPSKPDNPLA